MYFKKLEKNLSSPYQNFQWEIEKKVTINNFDESDKKCSTRLYYLKLDQLLFCPAKPIFEVNIGGQKIEFPDKCRCSEMTIIREVPKDEILFLIERANLDQKLGYKYSEALYPINPLLVSVPKINEDTIGLLKNWNSVRNSVGNSVCDSVSDSVRNSIWASVWASVCDSVWDSVWDSVCDSVGDSACESVCDSVGAYVSSLFPKIENWIHIEHKKGVNPFQACIDLWKSGLVPSYDGTTWRLHGEESKILYEAK